MDDIFNGPSNMVARDFVALFLGKELGFGAGRKVYECVLDKEYVIKVETGARSFQNVREWEIWNEVQHTKYKKYFAPCLAISPCGSVLLQRKCQTAPRNKYPKKLPHFLTDTKFDNYGLFEGKFVCLDYGTFILTGGMTDRMKSVKWWETPY